MTINEKQDVANERKDKIKHLLIPVICCIALIAAIVGVCLNFFTYTVDVTAGNTEITEKLSMTLFGKSDGETISDWNTFNNLGLTQLCAFGAIVFAALLAVSQIVTFVLHKKDVSEKVNVGLYYTGIVCAVLLFICGMFEIIGVNAYFGNNYEGTISYVYEGTTLSADATFSGAVGSWILSIGAVLGGAVALVMSYSVYGKYGKTKCILPVFSLIVLVLCILGISTNYLSCTIVDSGVAQTTYYTIFDKLDGILTDWSASNDSLILRLTAICTVAFAALLAVCHIALAALDNKEGSKIIKTACYSASLICSFMLLLCSMEALISANFLFGVNVSDSASFSGDLGSIILAIGGITGGLVSLTLTLAVYREKYGSKYTASIFVCAILVVMLVHSVIALISLNFFKYTVETVSGNTTETYNLYLSFAGELEGEDFFDFSSMGFRGYGFVKLVVFGAMAFAALSVVSQILITVLDNKNINNNVKIALHYITIVSGVFLLLCGAFVVISSLWIFGPTVILLSSSTTSTSGAAGAWVLGLGGIIGGLASLIVNRCFYSNYSVKKISLVAVTFIIFVICIVAVCTDFIAEYYRYRTEGYKTMDFYALTTGDSYVSGHANIVKWLAYICVAMSGIVFVCHIIDAIGFKDESGKSAYRLLIINTTCILVCMSLSILAICFCVAVDTAHADVGIIHLLFPEIGAWLLFLAAGLGNSGFAYSYLRKIIKNRKSRVENEVTTA